MVKQAWCSAYLFKRYIQSTDRDKREEGLLNNITSFSFSLIDGQNKKSEEDYDNG